MSESGDTFWLKLLETLTLPEVEMVGEISSQDSTPASAERSIVFHLILVTLAGEEIQMPIEL